MGAVRLVKGGQGVSVTAKVLGITKASLDNWVKLSAKGQLKGAGDKPVSAEQMELAAVIDLFSRQEVGWSMQPHLQSSLVTDALKMAWFRRQPAPGLILHTERGSHFDRFSGQQHGVRLKICH